MATKRVKKSITDSATEVAGLKSSRYEKMQISYGVIKAANYSFGDTLVFSEVPSKDIIKAKIVAHASSPVILEIYPATNVASALPILVGASKVDISYVIEYIRGSGVVGNGLVPGGDLLKITVGAS